jgi:predicted TPR repeat methyltransferase
MGYEESYDRAAAAFSSGDYEIALQLYQDILASDKQESTAIWGIAECFHSLGEISLAITWYHRFLELEPDEPEALHMLSALGEGRTPVRASDAYLKAHFDRFAEDFDSQLIGELDYRVPELLTATLEAHLGPASASLKILDAGCGTGLCGSKIKDYASRLDGVDISGEMLKFARRRKVYDKLFKDELCRYLRRSKTLYDVILSADTLCYFGDLASLFRVICRNLTEKGLFIFSVEAGDIESDYILTQSGRYSHGKSYIKKIADDCRLTEISMVTRTLRTEYGEPVRGDIWVLSKSGI